MSDRQPPILQRSYFPWIVNVILVVVVIWFIWRCFLAPFNPTTVYLVRHAEKADATSSDPALSPAGQARAQSLSHVLTQAGIDAVYVTEFQRTQMTGAPTALANGVTTAQYAAADTGPVVADILANHIGQEILLVGHSNTVDDLLDELGVPGQPELAETTFDRLFVVHRLGSDVIQFEALRYGAPTP